MKKVISFPHIGNYYLPISYFLRKTTKKEILIPLPITKKTIELGSKYSPDYVCVPFKYNLGNYLESLEKGANILLQGGGGCRYGYYAELQEKILQDLGYKFEFINFLENNHVSIKKIYQFVRRQNNKINILNFGYYLLNTIIMILIMDKLEKNIREKSGFEEISGSFINTEKQLISELSGNINIFKLLIIYFKYQYHFHHIKIKHPKKYLKVVIVGELFSILEPFSSCNIERELVKKNIMVKRYTTLSYLLLFKRFRQKKLLKIAKKYVKYPLGADGLESVALSIKFAKKGYDGIIHLKSFGCTPEINAMPILNRISNDYKIPITYFSFESNNNEVGIETRIEAFYDMLKMRNDEKDK